MQVVCVLFFLVWISCLLHRFYMINGNSFLMVIVLFSLWVYIAKFGNGAQALKGFGIPVVGFRLFRVSRCFRVEFVQS